MPTATDDILSNAIETTTTKRSKFGSKIRDSTQGSLVGGGEVPKAKLAIEANSEPSMQLSEKLGQKIKAKSEELAGKLAEKLATLEAELDEGSVVIAREGRQSDEGMSEVAGSRLSVVRVLPPESFTAISTSERQRSAGSNPRKSGRSYGNAAVQRRSGTPTFSSVVTKEEKRAKFEKERGGKPKHQKTSKRRMGFGGHFAPSSGPEFPTYNSIPPTRFSCEGRTEGYHADEEAQCQVGN